MGTHRHSRSGKDLPIGRPVRVFRRDEAIEMRKQGKSWRKIAEALDVPLATLVRATKKAA